MDLGLTGKRALVLAASRGLGFACASGLAREGCELVICSRDRARVDEAAGRIATATGARVHGVAADVGSPGAVDALVAEALARLGGIDIVVHNAGGPPAGDSASVSEPQWSSAFEANLMSFVRLVRAVAPGMRQQRWGRIIAITSSSIKQPIPNLVLSNAMRTGVLGFAKTVARELAPDGVLVNVVAPGRIATERLEELDRAVAAKTGRGFEEVRSSSIAAIPLGRLGRPEELANLVVFLASEGASYMTGTAIQVDGGMINALS